MVEAHPRLEAEDLQRHLREVQAELAAPASEALRAKLDGLHPADVAYILEALPIEQRLALWSLVKTDMDGWVLLEVSDAVRDSLIGAMERAELVAAVETLDADEIADLAPDLPQDVLEEVARALPPEERARLRAVLSYEEGTVGALMDFEYIAVRDDVTLETVTRELRRLDELPGHSDQLYVVDGAQVLRGVLPLARVVVADLDRSTAELLEPERMRFHPEDSAEEAARAFERYDLVSAPVVGAGGRLIGRLTVDAVVDYIRQRSAESELAKGGLAEEEDIFAPVLHSFRNRWWWLAINLVTAFIASRVIDAFENTIESLVALAALMPIVAGIGGNSGNQTITMIVRALALGQIQPGTWRKLVRREITVALMNGVVWGTLLGAIVFVLYRNLALGGVLALAMVLNLVLSAVMGVAIPWARVRLGRDPAMGSSVLITACTDSGGFFIFLGLASLLLV